MSNAPLLKGGQGRSDMDVENSSAVIVWIALAAVVALHVLIAVAIWGTK